MDILENMQCPKCGERQPNEKYIKDGAYICAHRNSEGFMCGTIVGVFCKQCNKIYNEDDFGIQNDVYVCKECGKTQWGFTEYKRDMKNLLGDIKKATVDQEQLVKYMKKLAHLNIKL